MTTCSVSDPSASFKKPPCPVLTSCVVALVVFVLYPLLHSLIFVFFQSPATGDSCSDGCSAVLEALQAGGFVNALGHSALYALITTVLLVPLSLWIALRVHGGRGKKCGVCGSMWPPMILAGLFFVLLMVGVSCGSSCATSGTILRIVLMGLMLAMVVNFNKMLFLAALKTSDPALAEAAEQDGASRGQVFRFVTLPAIQPAIGCGVAISVIGSYTLFDLPFILAGGNCESATCGVSILRYFYAVVAPDGGFSSGVLIGWLLLMLAFLASMLRVVMASGRDSQCSR